MALIVQKDRAVWTVSLNRSSVRNAVDGPTARALSLAFREFDADDSARVAVLTGMGSDFCAGADLRSVAAGPHGTPSDGMGLALNDDMQADGPMGPTRLNLRKPVIAAIEGHAVAGGLELALWCDMRVASATAVLGVFCRRFGVPLIDGGTVRLPRLIGRSRALDMILTGRPVAASEALEFGLVNRVVAPGGALAAARELAEQIAHHPQECMRNDRASALRESGLPMQEALAQEFEYGKSTLRSGEALAGAARFVAGAGRHGSFEPPFDLA
ncbi:MAG: crotonase/enoyl-CoA hydratase family protein [Burkholderiaceae bacterium]